MVNNAGVGGETPFEAIKLEMFDRMIAVNLKALFQLAQLAAPAMRARGWGRIINIASQLAYKGSAGLAHYCAAKAGIIAFTRSLSHEIGTSNITANCVAPGATQTKMVEGLDKHLMESLVASIPKGRLATVDEIVPAYVFLASEEARHFVGQCLSPNGGDVML